MTSPPGRVLAEKQWGGLLFRLRASRGTRELQSAPDDLKTFDAPRGAVSARDVISVFFGAGAERAADDGRPLYSSAEGWRMFWEDGRRVAVHHPAVFKQSLWKAGLGWPLKDVHLRLGPPLKTGRPGRWHNPFRYPLDLIVTMYALASRQGLILHGAGAVFRGGGWIFAGRSGAGKSTLSDILLREWPEAELLNDDRVIVRRRRGRWRVYGTPWSGRLRTCRADEAPLRGIFLLEHGTRNRRVPLKAAEAVERLLPVCSIPWYDRPLVQRLLPLVDRLAREVPVAQLVFRPDGTLARYLRNYPDLRDS